MTDEFKPSAGVPPPAAAKSELELRLSKDDVTLLSLAVRSYRLAAMDKPKDIQAMVFDVIQEGLDRLLLQMIRGERAHILASPPPAAETPTDGQDRPNWLLFLRHVAGCLTCQVKTERICSMGSHLLDNAEPFSALPAVPPPADETGKPTPEDPERLCMFGESLQEELDARGWTTRDVAERLVPLKQLELDLLIAVAEFRDPHVIVSNETLRDLDHVFGVSEGFFQRVLRMPLPSAPAKDTK